MSRAWARTGLIRRGDAVREAAVCATKRSRRLGVADAAARRCAGNLLRKRMDWRSNVSQCAVEGGAPTNRHLQDEGGALQLVRKLLVVPGGEGPVLRLVLAGEEVSAGAGSAPETGRWARPQLPAAHNQACVLMRCRVPGRQWGRRPCLHWGRGAGGPAFLATSIERNRTTSHKSSRKRLLRPGLRFYSIVCDVGQASAEP
ncbi:Protein of unknown function [Gryllus bimaculatus]|nr:Protein of unknown function [Gryllus bimaculatus]